MEPFFERQIQETSIAGEKSDAADAEESVRMTKGQIPSIDATVTHHRTNQLVNLILQRHSLSELIVKQVRISSKSFFS